MFLIMVEYHGNEKLKGMVEYNIFNNWLKLTSFPSFLVIFVDVLRQLFAVSGFSPCPTHLLHHIFCVLVSGRYGSWFTCMYLKCVLTSFVQKC